MIFTNSTKYLPTFYLGKHRDPLDNTPVGELVVILSGENQNLETAKAGLQNAEEFP